MITSIILALVVTFVTTRAQAGCDTKADITFLVDSSDNVGKDNFQKELGFINDVANKLVIGPDKVQISAATFGSKVTNQIYLNQYKDGLALQNAIPNIPFNGGRANIANAIRFVRNTSFAPVNGGRSDAPHLAVLLTNQPSGAIDMTKLESQTARDDGIVLCTVGIGEAVDQNELKVIASDPDTRHVYSVQNFDALSSLSDLLAIKLCNELPPSPSILPVPAGCMDKADLVFMVDSSTSVGNTNFQEIEHFLKDIISKVNVGQDKVHVGLVHYGSYPSIAMSLGQHRNRTEVMKALESMTYLGGGTNDAAAIELTAGQVFNQNSGARGEVPRIAVLITDGGSSNPAAVVAAANKARTQNISIIAVGVGSGVNHMELNSIANAPSKDFVFNVHSYRDLVTATDSLIKQMCAIKTTQISLTTSSPGVTLPPDPCQNKIANCEDYGNNVCTDYRTWSRDNCARHCQICTPLYTVAPPKCEDILPNCSSYRRDECTRPGSLVQVNCKLFCGLCGTNTSLPGYYGHCSYKGKAYKTAETWYDGCDYECFCEDGNTGRYKCNNRCPVYHDLPRDCTLVAKPGQCCLQPVCNFSPTVNTQTASGRGQTSTGIDVCVFKGRQYYQGQFWREGCDYQCQCTDAKTGLYKCEDLCPTYHSIPPFCRLEKKAGECCSKPACEFDTQVGSFTGSGSISGNGVGAKPPAQPQCADALPSCSVYTKSVCTEYRGWSNINCKKFCDLCSDEAPKPGPEDRCIFNGRPYQQGDTWNTSCRTHCTCENAVYGYYRCLDSCPTYNNIPSGCRMVSLAGECCPSVQCDTGYFLSSSTNPLTTGNGANILVKNPPSGMTQLISTSSSGETLTPGTGTSGFTASSLSGCLYKGQLYYQDQAWEDGCQYACICKDAGTGLYACKEKCPSYPTLPPSCLMKSDSNDACCKAPHCSPDPVTHQIPVPIPVFQPATHKHSPVAPPTAPQHETAYNRTMALVPTGFTPAPPTAGTVGHGGYCVYGGQKYQQGQVWEDGCEFNCVCDDASKGHYTCIEKCVHYPSIPERFSCKLIQDPANPCCNIPMCSFNPIYITHVGQAMKTTAKPRGDFCVYDGQRYREGQTWYDGCGYRCACEDAANNVYRCLSRCPEYENVAASCTFIADPRDPSCCMMPQCPTTSSVTGTTGMMVPTPAPAGTYTGQGSSTGYCEHKGVRYGQGQTWQDGCDLRCMCTDAESGFYRCSEICPRYSIEYPEYCMMVPDFKNPCCKIPSCIFPTHHGTISGMFAPSTTVAPTPTRPGQTPATHVGPTPTPQYSYCLYKNVKYFQGQSWEDGCHWRCRCDNADRGLYVCSERCATYTAIPENCTLVTDPEDSCCVVPSCQPLAPATSAPGTPTQAPGVPTPAPGPYKIPTPAPGVIQGSVHTPTGLSINVCEYKGVQYSQGQTWNDGCQFTCECLDAKTGKYRCVERCSPYVNLPSYCQLRRDPANPCCHIPVCSHTLTPTGTMAPTASPEPPKNVCVYKGKSYTQGQTWYDGCDFSCMCEDQMTGLYTCNNRCPRYGQLPANCSLATSSSDPFCCKEPVCVFQNTKNQTSGYLTPPSLPLGVLIGGAATPRPRPSYTGETPVPGYITTKRPTPFPGYISTQSPIPFPGSGTTQGPTPFPGSGSTQGPIPFPGSGTTQGPTPFPGSGTTQGPIPYPGSGTTQGPTPFPGSGTTQKPTPYPGSGMTQGPTPFPGSGTTQKPTPFPGTGTTQGPTPYPGSGMTQGPTPFPGSGTTQKPTPYPGSGTTQGPTPFPGSGTTQKPTPFPGTGTTQGPIPFPGSGTTQGPTPYPGSGMTQGPTPFTGSGTTQKPTPYPGSGTTQGPTPLPGSGTTQKPTPFSGTTQRPDLPTVPVCLYKGKSYTQGQKWRDGCDYDCVCQNAISGQYRCVEMCPRYDSLPAGSVLVADPYNPCCKKAYIPAGMVPTPAPHKVSTQKPSPMPKGCVYHGVPFSQGQKWNDGCDLQCVCENGTTGFYNCRDRCSKYALAQGCTFVTDPKDSCCKIPDCPPVPTPTPGPAGITYQVPTRKPGTFDGTGVIHNGHPTGCVYNGVTYKQGQAWSDGCKYNCTCLNEQTGDYRCVERCMPQLPQTFCYWVPDPRDSCCKIPLCGMPSPAPQQTVTPSANPLHTNEPKVEACVMDGVQYVTGQTWNRGCNKRCVCEDGKTGFVRCYDRCSRFPSMPSNCTLVPDPHDPTCCMVPQCIPMPGLGLTVPTDKPFTVAGVTGLIQGNGRMPTSNTGGFTSAPRNACIYSGRVYSQGQKWQDGCQYNCVCIDAGTGRYECTERCATFPYVPPQCTMERSPDDVCCFRPSCNYSQPVPAPFPIPTQSPGVTPAHQDVTTISPALPQSYCVYNGVPFRQGQTWQDGCKKRCRCDNANKNIYSCFDRCNSYTTVPGCVMVSDPVDLCCQVPKCTKVPALGGPTTCPYPMPTALSGVITGGPQSTGGLASNIGHCEYKGVQYKQSQTWDDDCSYRCSCTDGRTGQYQCRERCPRYVDLPAYCRVVQDPNDTCCTKPVCDACPSTGGLTPTPGPTKFPSSAHKPTEVCIMNGKHYSEGQKWYVGCDKICLCDDGKTGTYSCIQRCPAYENIAGCTMVPDPTDPVCCQAPSCPGITGVFGIINGTGTPPPPTKGPNVTGSTISTSPMPKICVYKGKPYAQGQKWQDGCSYDCECMNADTGNYKCVDRCLRYPNLPSGCTLVQDAANPCCLKPVCPSLTPTPSPDHSPQPIHVQTPSPDFCVYHGIPLRQGQTLTEGCGKLCTCEEAKTGRITCTDRCQTYPHLMPNCKMITDPQDQCCQIPSCFNASTQTPTGVQGSFMGSNMPDIKNNPYGYTGIRNRCIYNGKLYSQGVTWDDGCSYTCQCLDAAKGLYRCTDKCLKFPPLPSYCRMVEDPNNTCCQIPYCTPPAQIYATPGPSGKPIPQQNMCVYKGSAYILGQQWYDGCDYICRCENASTNFYSCQQRCAAYTNTKNGCTVVPDPRDPTCCELPSCPVTPPVGPTPTPGVLVGLNPSGVIFGYGPAISTGATNSSGHRNGCIYKGMIFHKGDKFDDGCDYRCECMDDTTGKYRCIQKCQTYPNLPEHCVLIQDKNDACCRVPYCNFGPNTVLPTPGPLITPTPGPGVVTVAPYVTPKLPYMNPVSNPSVTPSPNPQPAGFCVYKGVYYTQGETWNDGCQQRCRCDNRQNGIYTCFQRCPSYSKSSCPWRADPMDPCCLVPDCTTGNIPTPIPNPVHTHNATNPTVLPVPVSGTFTGTSGGNGPYQLGYGNFGLRSACVYKGAIYTEGQTWQDGCAYNCSCIDASQGRYTCTDRCGKYPYLPSYCQYQPSPTDTCCREPVCHTYLPLNHTSQVAQVSDKCIYTDGGQYPKGATWSVNCSLTCVCNDPAVNNFKCTDRCPIYYDLPSICTLVKDPNDTCCTMPQCALPGGVTLTAVTGYGPTGNGTRPTSLEVIPLGTRTMFTGYGRPTATNITGRGEGCVYKGVAYNQSQGWDDGCNYNCTCVNGHTGMYRCSARCPTYPVLPSYCRAASVPGQCCKSISCDIPGYGNYIPGLTITGKYPGDGYYLVNATNPEIIGGIRDKCLYKSRLYNQGQSWEDGCSYSCECLDAKTGYYYCKPICPIYDHLPSNKCYMARVTGECCAVPRCYDKALGLYVNPLTSNKFPVVGTFSNGFSGFRPGYFTQGRPVITGQDRPCLYKGKIYHKGEKWEDGCDFECTCVDDTKGMYQCMQKCASYTSLPPACRLEPLAGNCCKKLVCNDSSMVTPAGPVTDNVCFNHIDNCRDYVNVCSPRYEAWARRNCNAYCHYCNATTPTPPPCVDKVSDCASYKPNSCTGIYKPWAMDNCAKYCGFCGTTTTASTVTVTTVTTTTCKDALDSCDLIDTSYYCSGAFKAWAVDNCRKTCGLCNETSITTATSSIMTSMTTTYQPPSLNGTTHAPSEVCIYKGKHYAMGERWQDGCSYKCICEDASVGFYKCTNLCPQYTSLPAGCNLIKKPGECCGVPDCTTVAPHNITQNPTAKCLYKGVYYSQDQTWNDGCSQSCTCTDESQGMYYCRGLCLKWQLPASCHFDDAPPGLCCPQPKCPSSIIVTVTKGYEAQYPGLTLSHDNGIDG